MEGKDCRLAFVVSSSSEKEGEREREKRKSFENGLSDVVDVDGRSHWDIPNARVTGYIHFEILSTNTPGSRDRW